MKKRIILITIIGLFLMMLPLMAGAEIVESGSCGTNDVSYTLDDTGLLIISGTGYMTSHPWTVDGKNKSRIVNVIINPGIKNIVDYAFYYGFIESSLQSISIPNSVNSIGAYAFTSSSLTSIVIPDSVNEIGAHAFDSCKHLIDVTMSNNVVQLEYTFENCSGLSRFVIPNGITILTRTFENCSNLTQIAIPNSVIELDGTFCDCSNLSNIELPNSVIRLGDNTFTGTKIRTITIPETITYIGAGCFSQCAELKEITIPSSVTVIDYRAFYKCYQLTDVIISSSQTTMSREVFKDCFELASIAALKCNNLVIQWIIDNDLGSLLHLMPHPLFKHDRVKPTYTTPGTEEYWECSVCGKLFSDENGENEISEPVVIPMLEQTDISGAKTNSIKDQVYTGKAIKPNLTIKYDGKKLIEGTDYTLTYKSNKKVGKATITVKGIGAYTGTKTVAFNILPKAVKLSSLKAGKNQLTVKWKKGSNIDGYEIQYGLKKNFKSAKMVTITKAKTTNTVIKKLKKGKTYYVRIRAFKKVSGKKYYSEWSKALNKKIK